MEEELRRKPLPKDKKELPFWPVTLSVVGFSGVVWWFIGGEILRFIDPYL